MSLKDRITERLGVLNLSMRKASIDAGLGESAIRDLIRNEAQSPRIDTLKKLAPVLQTTTDWLMHGHGAKFDNVHDIEENQVLLVWSKIPRHERIGAMQMLKGFALLHEQYPDNWSDLFVPYTDRPQSQLEKQSDDSD